MPQKDPARFQHIEVMGFRLCMWVVVAGSFGAIATKAIWHRPSDVSVQFFLVLAVIASVLAAFGPSLGVYASSRLRKISFAGFEVELNVEVEQASRYLVDVPSEEQEPPSGEPAECDPFPSKKVSRAGLYQYERSTIRLYMFLDQVRDPSAMDLKARESFRKLIRLVGGTALRTKDYIKALDILLKLESVSDREDLSFDDLRLLGSAHLWAAQYALSKRMEYWEEAVVLLKAAKDKNPYDAATTYSLAWALLSTNRYNDAITLMQKCEELDKSIAPWARWNAASGLMSLGKQDEALKTLEQIEPGCWWDGKEGIAADPDFKDWKEPAFRDRFLKLCQSRIGAAPS